MNFRILICANTYVWGASVINLHIRCSPHEIMNSPIFNLDSEFGNGNFWNHAVSRLIVFELINNMQATCRDQFKKYVLTSYDKHYLIIWYEKLISRLPFLGVISLRVLELVNNADNMSSKRKKWRSIYKVCIIWKIDIKIAFFWVKILIWIFHFHSNCMYFWYILHVSKKTKWFSF